MGTDFNTIYKRFYSKITDDMYMELEKEETDALLEELLINALPWFEFPRVNIHNYNIVKQRFNIDLSGEEINIIATYMIVGWLDQQLASVELARTKYSGSDFKFTSQANHMAKLTALRKEYERIGFHLQRLYKRRKTDSEGIARSTFGSIMSSSVRGGVSSTPSNPSPSPAPTPPTDDDDDTDDNWEDMEDVPGTNLPGTGGSGGWDDMEDLPGMGNAPFDGWDDL
jgi:hypothetical protein